MLLKPWPSLMSALGQKQTSMPSVARINVRFGSKLAAARSNKGVRFTPKSGHEGGRSPRPLRAKSGLMQHNTIGELQKVKTAYLTQAAKNKHSTRHCALISVSIGT